MLPLYIDALSVVFRVSDFSFNMSQLQVNASKLLHPFRDCVSSVDIRAPVLSLSLVFLLTGLSTAAGQPRRRVQIIQRTSK